MKKRATLARPNRKSEGSGQKERESSSCRERGGEIDSRAVDLRRNGNDRDAVEYLARCHCGVLTARYRTALQPSAWSVRACQCSFCRSHGALMTSDPAGSLTFSSEHPEQVSQYCFGGRTAQFLTCRECGVYVGVKMRTAQGRFGVLNLLALRPLMKELPAAQPMDYEGETPESRRLRREARWTPVSLESL
jgi:hypothetical protein